MPLRRWTRPQGRAAVAACAIALAAASVSGAQEPAKATAPSPPGTLDRLRAGGPLRIGYRIDARPFAYRDEGGQAAGYSIDLCRRIVDALTADAGHGDQKVQWIPVTAAERFDAVQQGRIDLLCGAETVTLSRRAQVSFSMPIFPGGLGALVRADSPARLRDVLSGRGQPFRPVWRASASRVLQARSFTAVRGTTSEEWLVRRVRELEIITEVAAADDYASGIQALLERRTDVLFGERAVLLDAAARHQGARDLLVIDRLFTYEPIALALPKNDEAFRLFVDRTLSRFYGSGELGELYTRWFGEPDETTLTFFKWNTLPE